ncbi:hypothetical protein DFJ77DRAFT_539583 [Powellomyces hirtus]|nr:hypothetical protein DFJ77DRAFT_539583 [Powellomyces hirtus]
MTCVQGSSERWPDRVVSSHAAHCRCAHDKNATMACMPATAVLLAATSTARLPQPFPQDTLYIAMCLVERPLVPKVEWESVRCCLYGSGTKNKDNITRSDHNGNLEDIWSKKKAEVLPLSNHVRPNVTRKLCKIKELIKYKDVPFDNHTLVVDVVDAVKIHVMDAVVLDRDRLHTVLAEGRTSRSSCKSGSSSTHAEEHGTPNESSRPVITPSSELSVRLSHQREAKEDIHSGNNAETVNLATGVSVMPSDAVKYERDILRSVSEANDRSPAPPSKVLPGNQASKKPLIADDFEEEPTADLTYDYTYDICFSFSDSLKLSEDVNHVINIFRCQYHQPLAICRPI